MTRHPALQDLSRDHLHALVQARSIRRAIDLDPAELDPVAVLRDLLVFWDDDAALHFREEEEVLLPIVARHTPPSTDEALRRMLDDHAWFRDTIVLLRRGFEAGEVHADLLGAFGRRLSDHVHLEERVIFDAMQERLTDRDLGDLAERSLAFRRACRTPDRIGPQTGTP